MEIQDLLSSELQKMNIDYETMDILQNKDGVIVARVYTKVKPVIIKLFLNPDFCREIGYYEMLASLGIPTIAILSATDTALLMEDVCESAVYRLGEEADSNSPEIAVLIARWYKLLHWKGYEYIKQHGDTFYDENQVITLENMHKIQVKTNTAQLPVWKVLEDRFGELDKLLGGVKRTLTYNDFYYKNLIVARDRTSALMYDYNLLGKGYAYADIRNVCFSLSDAAKEAFLGEYGSFDKTEAAVDEVASVLVDLHFACQKPQFPLWANASLNQLNKDLMDKVNRLL